MTKRNEPVRSSAAELRRRAEEQLRVKSAEFTPLHSEEELQKLVHELEVHQIELEMQNTELSQARNEMEYTLARYMDLYDFAPVGYFTLDRTGTINAVNLSGASLLGIERSQLIGQRFKQFIPADNRLFLVEFLATVFGSQIKESGEMTLITAGNTQLFVQIEAIAFQSGLQCRVAVIDITERRCAEQTLIEQRRELEELNKSLGQRITQAVNDIRQQDQMLILQGRRAAMGEMLNNIAHQWRQPLNALALYVQELPLAYDTNELDRAFLENHAKQSMETIHHMSRTIDDFRNFFKANKETVTFNICKVVTHALSLIVKSFEHLGITITFHTHTDTFLCGYPNEYAQVVLNIMMNARDAFVERTIDDARIDLRLFTENSVSVLTITDNAGGIANEIIDRLFDPYFTTKGPDKGTGIGLYMSKTIIEKNMGGRLLASNTGSGAEFRIEV